MKAEKLPCLELQVHERATDTIDRDMSDKNHGHRTYPHVIDTIIVHKNLSRIHNNEEDIITTSATIIIQRKAELSHLITSNRAIIVPRPRPRNVRLLNTTSRTMT